MPSTRAHLVILEAGVKDDWRRNVLRVLFAVVLVRLLSQHQTFLPQLGVSNLLLGLLFILLILGLQGQDLLSRLGLSLLAGAGGQGHLHWRHNLLLLLPSVENI